MYHNPFLKVLVFHVHIQSPNRCWTMVEEWSENETLNHMTEYCHELQIVKKIIKLYIKKTKLYFESECLFDRSCVGILQMPGPVQAVPHMFLPLLSSPPPLQ